MAQAQEFAKARFTIVKMFNAAGETRKAAGGTSAAPDDKKLKKDGPEENTGREVEEMEEETPEQDVTKMFQSMMIMMKSVKSEVEAIQATVGQTKMQADLAAAAADKAVEKVDGLSKTVGGKRRRPSRRGADNDSGGIVEGQNFQGRTVQRHRERKW